MKNRVLFILSVTQMWKFFSHYGVRTLLVLYLVQNIGLSDARAFGMNAVFCGLVELGGILGGLLADRYLGLKKATFVGGWLLALGYSTFFFEKALLLAMGLVILGGSLFAGNITALLGQVFSENDPNRKKGFTIFYMMQNLGGLVSTLVCAFVAMRYGYRIAFALAASGMWMGNLMLLSGHQVLKNLEKIPARRSLKSIPFLIAGGILIVGTAAIYYDEAISSLLPWITGAVLIVCARRLLKESVQLKDEIYKLFIFLGALILFFAVEDQICSSLILFSERETSRTLAGFIIPSSVITSINPIVILLCGAWMAHQKGGLKTPFILTGGAFGLLAICCLMHITFPLLGVMGVVAVISIAELMIAPLVMSYASEVAARGNPGMVMGMLPIAFSMAFQVSGGLSQLVALNPVDSSLEVYGMGFGMMSLLMFFTGSAIHILIKGYANAKNSVC